MSAIGCIRKLRSRVDRQPRHVPRRPLPNAQSAAARNAVRCMLLRRHSLVVSRRRNDCSHGRWEREVSESESRRADTARAHVGGRGRHGRRLLIHTGCGRRPAGMPIPACHPHSVRVDGGRPVAIDMPRAMTDACRHKDDADRDPQQPVRAACRDQPVRLLDGIEHCSRQGVQES